MTERDRHDRELHFVIPGPLEQRTGGYLYDARMVHGLRRRGWTVTVHNLDGRFPDGDAQARAALEGALASIPGGSSVVIDGLAMGGLPASVARHQDRLRILGLVHHPLADETGLSDAEKAHFTETERAALEGCAGVLVTSGYTAHRLEDFGVAAARVRAIPPGTEPAPPADGPAALSPMPAPGYTQPMRGLWLIGLLVTALVVAGASCGDDETTETSTANPSTGGAGATGGSGGANVCSDQRTHRAFQSA